MGYSSLLYSTHLTVCRANVRVGNFVAAAQTREELAKQLKEASKNFEVNASSGFGVFKSHHLSFSISLLYFLHCCRISKISNDCRK